MTIGNLLRLSAQMRVSPPTVAPVRFGFMLTLALVMLGIVGCATSDFVSGSNFVPSNVHVSNRQLPPGVRRVAILPMTSAGDKAVSAAGLELLHPILLDEMTKTKKFEVIPVLSEQLRHWTGKSSWNAVDKLPPDFLMRLQGELGCDAVLFSQLHVFHPYPPLAVGWNLKLVDVANAQILWAADEVVDSAEPSVANGARRYQRAQERLPTRLADSRSILVSPTRFGHYAANVILASLPER